MKFIRPLFCLPLYAIVLLFATQSMQAQVSTLPFQQFLGTYTAVTGGTALGGPTAGGYDDGYWLIPIGFNFPFNGEQFTQCYFGSNGYVALGAGTTTIGNALNSNFAGRKGVISPFNIDSEVDPNFPPRYQVTGSAPDRMLTIQFDNLHYWTAVTPTPYRYNYQVRLYETSGMIEIIYGPCTDNTSRTAYVGIASTTADFNRRVALTGINTWDTSTPENANTGAYSNFTATYGPPVGLTYRWGCFAPDGIVGTSISDASGTPQAFYYTPGSIAINYTVSYPLNVAYDVPITVNFYAVGDLSGIPAYTESFVAQKPVGVLNGLYAMNLNLPVGYYDIEVVFSIYNNCLMYEDAIAKTSALFILPGTTLCEVWPGDTDNNGVVNYADRASLNEYIHNANLSPLWLQGPARYLAAAASNPLAYLEWTPQASIPWNTPDGCYKDTDGNGVINNFDYIAIKMNWLRSDAVIPAKSGNQFSLVSFDMDQNFPNPFNPTTSIRYSAPERSMVRLVVNDMFGREVAMLANETVEAGVHTVQFDAGQLASGTYITTISMVGEESGLTFNKTMKMALNK